MQHSSKDGVPGEYGYVIKMEVVQYKIHSMGCCQMNCPTLRVLGCVTDTWETTKPDTIK